MVLGASSVFFRNASKGSSGEAAAGATVRHALLSTLGSSRNSEVGETGSAAVSTRRLVPLFSCLSFSQGWNILELHAILRATRHHGAQCAHHGIFV